MRGELWEREDFDEALREEIQVSSEFGLVLCVLSILLPEGPDARLIRRLLDAIRAADLAALVSPDELAVVLPNISVENAHVVAGRLRAAVPSAEMGEASYLPGDTSEALLARARRDRQGREV